MMRCVEIHELSAGGNMSAMYRRGAKNGIREWKERWILRVEVLLMEGWIHLYKDLILRVGECSYTYSPLPFSRVVFLPPQSVHLSRSLFSHAPHQVFLYSQTAQVPSDGFLAGRVFKGGFLFRTKNPVFCRRKPGRLGFYKLSLKNQVYLI